MDIYTFTAKYANKGYISIDLKNGWYKFSKKGEDDVYMFFGPYDTIDGLSHGGYIKVKGRLRL